MFDVDDRTPNEHDAYPDRDADAFDPVSAEEELATLSAHLDAATYRQLVLIRLLDERGHWLAAGATSCAAWLSFRIGLDIGAARERIRVAHALRDLPSISEAMRLGTISFSKVRAITRVANPSNEVQLLEYASYTTAAQLERICRGVRQAQLLGDENGAPIDEAELLRRAHAARDVSCRSRGDGTVVLFATLLPDEADRVLRAVEAMRDAMREESPALPPSYADAFVRLIDVGYEDATVAVAPASAQRTVNVHGEANEKVGLDVSAEGALGASEYEWSDIFAARGRLEVSAEGALDTSEHERSDVSAERRSDVSAEGAFGGAEREGAVFKEEVRSDVSSEAAFDEAHSDVSTEGAAGRPDADVSAAADVPAEPLSSRLRASEPLHDRAADLAPERGATDSAPRHRQVRGGDVHRVVVHLAPHLLSDGLVANLDDGTWIAPETWRRVACDCALDLVKVDETGSVLDVGRRTRTIPPALARALDVRDAGRCRFPGCTHRRFLDRHHVKHWSNLGETKLDNLVTLCAAHHQLLHEGGWSVELDGDEARFFQPDGMQLVWPRSPRVEDALADLEDAHVSLEIGPATGLTLWDGKTPDYAWCVEALF
ncbi:MAG: HNH endonuclease [Myxococcota bacterium]|jgi:hypothetical protein|nr:HNH endonuclease [Myxococcota bacterium]